MLKEHEKFWAFLALGAGVLALAVLVMFKTPENEMALRIIDAAVGGFLLALGSAANALFRVSSDKQQADALQSVVDKLPPPTGEAAQSAADPLPSDDGRPEWTQ